MSCSELKAPVIECKATFTGIKGIIANADVCDCGGTTIIVDSRGNLNCKDCGKYLNDLVEKRLNNETLQNKFPGNNQTKQ